MFFGKTSVRLFLLFLFFALVVGSVFFVKRPLGQEGTDGQTLGELTRQEFKFEKYSEPDMQKKKEYQIVMIGDSMTHALGPRGGTMSEFINELYQTQGSGVIIDNYAQGSKNILQAEEQLASETKYWEFTFPPLLSRDFDLILIESFGYNPLSHLGTEAGLIKQTETLDTLMTRIISEKPNSRVVFVATIAPNRENYAKNILKDIAVEERIKQADERMAYIRNHIEYANAHGIPVINIFEKTLDASGNGDLRYINPSDFIHPSLEGVDFIGHEIASFIFNNNILPH